MLPPLCDHSALFVEISLSQLSAGIKTFLQQSAAVGELSHQPGLGQSIRVQACPAGNLLAMSVLCD